MHCNSWKHSSKIHFPHVLLITSAVEALAQPVTTARVGVRHTFSSRVTKEGKTY